VFQLNLSLQSQAEAIAQFAVSSLGLFDLAVIYPQDAYGEGLSRIFRDRATSLGGRVIAMKGYELGTTDFRDQISAVKASAPQAVFIPAYPDDIVLIAPQLRYYEFEGTILGAGGWHSEKVVRLGEEYVEGAVFAAMETEHGGGSVSREFEGIYEALYGSKPSRHSALGYDAIQLIQNASRDPATTREALMERLSMVTSYRGSSGVISLASRENVAGQARIYTIHRGVFRRIE
jgi:branched-chain amino acid transport system substrate-binding protein